MRGAGFKQLLRVTGEKREKAYGLERKVLIKRWVKDKEVGKQRQWSNRERQWDKEARREVRRKPIRMKR